MFRIFIFLCFMSFTINSFSKSLSVTICWEDGLKPPYLMLNDKKEPIGFAVDLLNNIFEKENVVVSHIVVPWKRCLNDVEKGKVDIVPNASINPEREGYAYFTDKPLYQTHLVLFYLDSEFKKQPVVPNLVELKKYTIGGIFGFNYDYYKSELQIDTSAKNRLSLLTMLKGKRFQFIVEQLEIYKYMEKLSEANLQGISYIPNPVAYERNFFVMVSKKSAEAEKIKRIMDEGILRIKQDGTEKKYSKNYFGE